SQLAVRHVDEDLVARPWLRHHDERPYSLVDATRFARMRHLRIRVALAFAGDFSGRRLHRGAPVASVHCLP
ncbi:MAG: hypothetical protein C4307_01385, partial [Chloroflexota bacterium]